MPEESEKEVVERAHEYEREGKSASTQAGEFVREEMHHVREGKHGARSPQQAIAIGLSKARRAGVKLSPPKPGATSSKTRRQAERDLNRGRHPRQDVCAALACRFGSASPRKSLGGFAFGSFSSGAFSGAKARISIAPRGCGKGCANEG
jgi:hypothetical protein